MTPGPGHPPPAGVALIEHLRPGGLWINPRSSFPTVPEASQCKLKVPVGLGCGAHRRDCSLSHHPNPLLGVTPRSSDLRPHLYVMGLETQPAFHRGYIRPQSVPASQTTASRASPWGSRVWRRKSHALSAKTSALDSAGNLSHALLGPPVWDSCNGVPV